jgi:cyclopropane fatty-acyl-phospholipid synthase-like methyltransferase
MNDLHANDDNWLEFGKRKAQESEECKQNGWNSTKAQERRFRVFYEELCQGDSILDVGCGTGGLYGYLMKNSNIKFSYVGTDLSNDLLKIAKDRYPAVADRFNLVDIIDNRGMSPHQFDVVVASGIFSERKFKSLEYLDEMISKMMMLSSRVVAFNLLSTFGDEIKEGSRYWSPSEVIMILSKYTKRFKIIHDYASYDFTCVLYVP